MDNKICVYAICKNESQFVDRWYESMKEADEIVVLDTGSTDDTIEQLKKYPRIKIAQKIYKELDKIISEGVLIEGNKHGSN